MRPIVPAYENGKIASAPSSAMIRRHRAAMRAIASSQAIGSNRPSPFGPTRASGRSTRSDECTRSAYARTLPQMTPRVNGCAALPTTDDSRSPATVTSRLHAEGQSCGQTLGTNRILVRWRADAQPLRSTEPVQDARQSAPRGPVRDRLLLPGHVVPAEPADHDRAEGARDLRRSGRDVLLDHDAAVAHQAPLRIALGLRAALGLPAQELLSPDDRAGRARGRDAGDG